MLKGIRWLVRFAVARAFFRGVRDTIDEIAAVRDADEEAEAVKLERPWRTAPGRLRSEDLTPGREVWKRPFPPGPGSFSREWLCAHGVVQADGTIVWLPHRAVWDHDVISGLSFDEAGCYLVLYESEAAARSAPDPERRGEDECR